jgi:SlyX protein
MDDRVTELEVKLAYAEDLLDSLNTTVFRQQERIAQLEQQLRDVRGLVLQALPAEQRSLREDIPPHY